MGIDRFRTALARHRCVALYTSIFIYHLESNPKYRGLADCVFAWLESTAGSKAVTSAITMTELLVKPYRETGEDQVNTLYALLSTYPNLEWIPSSLEIAALAAKIRAQHRLRTPGALQTATALLARATAMITNDPIFKRVPGFDVLVLDEWL